jgi:DNA polymerase III alpha subunit
MIAESFVRVCPSDPRYEMRLNEELELIKELDFEEYFHRLVEVRDLLEGVPFITRGSAGSSLVIYLLGISDIDPVAEGIPIERFLNRHRPKPPDCDFDFPHYVRDEVFRKIKAANPATYRISNKLTYRRKSALRQALKIHGYKGNLPKNFDLLSVVKNLAKDAGEEHEPLVIKVKETAENLIGKRYGTSLHCGGYVQIDDLSKYVDKIISPIQVDLDKEEAEKEGLLKIDILSNRGLGHLINMSDRPIHEYPDKDPETIKLLQRGDTLGVTQAESPAFRKMLRALVPKNVKDVILATGLIRPAAASRGRKQLFLDQRQRGLTGSDNLPVFEDDVNDLIAKTLNVPLSKADKYRRGFASGKEDVINEFFQQVPPNLDIEEVLQDIYQFKEYSMCRAHATSYGRMIYALAWHKAHNTHKFWESALNNCQSMYRPWVYVEEAKKAGVQVFEGKGQWKLIGTELHREQEPLVPCTSGDMQYEEYGYWTADDPFGTYANYDKGSVKFKCLIGTYRRYKKDTEYVTFVTGMVGNEMLDFVIEDNVDLHRVNLIQGIGDIQEAFGSHWVRVHKHRVIK